MKMIQISRKTRATAAAVVIVLTTGLGQVGPFSQTTHAKSLTQVTLRLPWVMSGYMDPFTLASARGYYAKAGLQVNIQEGKGSLITGETVASGADQFGYADLSAIAPLISKGATIKAIAGIEQQSALSFVYRAPTVIKTPRDLIGHPIVTNASDNASLILPAVLKRYNVTQSRLTFDMVQPTAYAQAFLGTPNSVLLSNVNSTFQVLRAGNPSIKAKLFSKFGVNLLSFGLITNTDMIRRHKKLVAAFVKASLEGWNYAVKHPAAATSAAKAAFPQIDSTIELNELKATLKLLHTKHSKGHVLGWMAKKDWVQTISLLHKYSSLDPVRSVNTYYTDQFIPGK